MQLLAVHHLPQEVSPFFQTACFGASKRCFRVNQGFLQPLRRERSSPRACPTSTAACSGCTAGLMKDRTDFQKQCLSLIPRYWKHHLRSSIYWVTLWVTMPNMPPFTARFLGAHGRHALLSLSPAGILRLMMWLSLLPGEKPLGGR